MVEMWKTERGIAAIERVECTRATSASVWYMTRRLVIGRQDAVELVETKAARHADRVNYPPTWEDAQAHLMEHAAFLVQSKRRQLEMANAHFGNVKGLRKPACGAIA